MNVLSQGAFSAIEDLVGAEAFRHTVAPFHDGQLHTILVDPLMSEQQAKQVYGRILQKLESEAKPGWIVLPGSRLLRVPRQISVIVPNEGLAVLVATT